MSSIFKIIIGLFIVLLLILVTILIVILFIQNKKKEEIMENNNNSKYSEELLLLINKDRDYDKLLEISFSKSGNMEGNVDESTLYIEKEILIHKEKAVHSDPLQVTEYKVNKKDILKLLKQIDEYNFPAWKDLEEYNEITAIDAPSKKMIFTYDNSKNGGPELDWYVIDFDKKMPDDGYIALKNFKDDLLKLIKKENKIKEYEEE